MPKTCIVINCENRSDRNSHVRFYPIPVARNVLFYPRTAEISKKRRELWLEALGRGGLTESTIKNARVCSKHFITGRPSSLEDDEHPDWVPSLHMRYAYKHFKQKDVIESVIDVCLHDCIGTKPVNPEANMNVNNIETIWGSDDSQTGSTPTSQSILDTIRDIQKNNPQIEAIFEDEDETNTSTQYDPQSPFDSDSGEDVQFVREIAPKPAPTKILPKPLPTEYMKVKAMTPAEMSPNLLQNGHTIVLQDPTKNAKLTKFLVIPKEIVPLLAKTKGPLAINIPGIGPLVISNPAEILVPKPNTLVSSPADILLGMNGKNTSVQAPKILPIVGGQVPPIIGDAPTSNASPRLPSVPVYDPITDRKYSCWLYRRNLKRDLEGFTMNDRLGFYKKEQDRGRQCVSKLAGIIGKLESSINESKKRLVSFRYNNSGFKLVDINSIKQAPKKFLRRRTATKKPENRPSSLSQVQEKNLKTIMSWKEHFLESKSKYSSTDSDDELLMTKKVVVLRDQGRGTHNLNPTYVTNTQAGPSRGRGRHSLGGREQKLKDDPRAVPSQWRGGHSFRGRGQKLNPKYLSDTWMVPSHRGRGGRGPRGRARIAITLRKQIKEEVQIKQEKDIKQEKEIKEEPLGSPPMFQAPRQRGRPRKRGKRGRAPVRSDPLKPSFNKDPLVTGLRETRFLVIDNLRQFQQELDAGKPLLVVNKDQCTGMNLTDMLEKNNVVFPLSKHSDIMGGIGTPAQVNQIKFVTPDVLGRHLGGATE